MRAARFAVELDFDIEFTTRRAIEGRSRGLEVIAKERVRDELVKVLMSPRAAKGVIMFEELGLLEYILPELREGMAARAVRRVHHDHTMRHRMREAMAFVGEADHPGDRENAKEKELQISQMSADAA